MCVGGQTGVCVSVCVCTDWCEYVSVCVCADSCGVVDCCVCGGQTGVCVCVAQVQQGHDITEL